LLLVVLLHALLVGALLQALDRAAPEASPMADAGVLLLDWPDGRQDSAPVPEDAAVPAPSAVDAASPPAGTAAPVVGAGRDRMRDVDPRQGAAQTSSGSSAHADWYSVGEAAARDFAERLDRPSTRPLDRRPTRPKPPAERTPKSVFDDDRSKVGRITRNADGETIYWLTPNCYVTLGSDSIALRDVHAMHEGLTFCRIPLGKREARGDLFEEMPTQRGSRYAEKYDPASTEPQPVR
jgi:hypothetical protein